MTVFLLVQQSCWSSSSANSHGYGLSTLPSFTVCAAWLCRKLTSHVLQHTTVYFIFFVRQSYELRLTRKLVVPHFCDVYIPAKITKHKCVAECWLCYTFKLIVILGCRWLISFQTLTLFHSSVIWFLFCVRRTSLLWPKNDTVPVCQILLRVIVVCWSYEYEGRFKQIRVNTGQKSRLKICAVWMRFVPSWPSQNRMPQFEIWRISQKILKQNLENLLHCFFPYWHIEYLCQLL